MLQQTTVQTATPFFERWMARFPTAVSLAAAEESEVLAYWQGLGYYTRARNLHIAARMVVEEGWPDSVDGWRRLPGVGAYTAGAIASIAQGIAAPLVDGNVERVYSRIAADPSTGSQLKNLAWDWAEQSLLRQNPGDWNQALMELGATICLPKNPKCGLCPVSDCCRAFEQGSVARYPTPRPAKAWVDLNHSTLIPLCLGKVGLSQMQPGEWWAGLWQPPRFPSPGLPQELSGTAVTVGTFKHTVTKHRITLTVFRQDQSAPTAGLTYVPIDGLQDIPLTAPGKKAIQMALAQYPKLPGLE